MKLPTFTYRYTVTTNGRYTSPWFTTRNEARAFRRELSTSKTSTYSVVRQPVTFGDSIPVS